MVITNGYGGTGEFQACNRKSKRSCSGADVLHKLIAELKTRVITENTDCVLRNSIHSKGDVTRDDS